MPSTKRPSALSALQPSAQPARRVDAVQQQPAEIAVLSGRVNEHDSGAGI